MRVRFDFLKFVFACACGHKNTRTPSAHAMVLQRWASLLGTPAYVEVGVSPGGRERRGRRRKRGRRRRKKKRNWRRTRGKRER